MNPNPPLQIVWDKPDGSKLILHAEYVAYFDGWRLTLFVESSDEDSREIPLNLFTASAAITTSVLASKLLEEKGI
jgi:hypothetical protein